MKYFLSIELRYTEKIFVPGEEMMEIDHISDVRRSKLFETEQEVVDFGNAIVRANNWIEQYPGSIGQRFTLRNRLITFSLRNGTRIIIEIEKFIPASSAGELTAYLLTRE